MSPAATVRRKRFLQLTARTGHNCARLRRHWNGSPRAILESALPVEAPSASNGYKHCHRQLTASSAKSNPSNLECNEQPLCIAGLASVAHSSWVNPLDYGPVDTAVWRSTTFDGSLSSITIKNLRYGAPAEEGPVLLARVLSGPIV